MLIHRRLMILVVLALSLVCLQPGMGKAGVSPHLKFKVAAGGSFVDLFTLNLPAVCSPAPCADDRVVVAKFIVSNTTDALYFKMEHTDPAKLTRFDPQYFGAGDPNVTLMDDDLGVPLAHINARIIDDAPLLATGYRIVKIKVRFDNNYNPDPYPAGETFKIQAQALAGTDLHYYGFWADGVGEAATEALVTKPKLINYLEDAQLTNFALFADFTSPTNLDFGEVHVNLPDEYLPDEQYQFRNVGTKALTIIGANPVSLPAGAYRLENYPSPPLAILPMAAFSRRVTCKPTALGIIPNVAINLTTDDPAQSPLVLNLTNGRGIRLNSAILFDISGSMLWDKDGNYPVPEEQQKIYRARLAALELCELYQGLLPDAQLGLYTYPNRNGDCASSQEQVALNEIKNNFQAFQNHLDRGQGSALLLVPPDAATPMAEGIAKVYDKLPKGEADQRQAVFHFGDGQHNCPTNNLKNDLPARCKWNILQTAGIPFFTIPYGAHGSGWMQTFTSLAANTGGEAFPADLDPQDLELQDQFKKALGKALDLESLKDPSGRIAAGGTAGHKVCVTASAHQLVFAVHWTAPNRNAIQVTVITPDHQTITPAVAAAAPRQVSYISGETFAGYVVRGDYLKGGKGSGRWTLHLRGNAATSYAYQVQAMDRLKTRTGFNLQYIGQLAEMVFSIKNGHRLIKNAQVAATYEAPAASFHNYLASTPIEPKLVFEAPAKLEGRPLSLADRKLYALTHFARKPFPRERMKGKLTFEEEAVRIRKSSSSLPGVAEAQAQTAAIPVQDQVFKAPFEKAKYDGLYTIKVQVSGLTARDECFEREYTIARWADVLLSKDLLKIAVKMEEVKVGPYFEARLKEILTKAPPEGLVRKAIVFTPKDGQGNFFGIGRTSEISFAVKGAEVLSSPQDLLDGSYVQVVQYKKGEKPQVTVTAAGMASPEIPLETTVDVMPGCSCR